MSGLGKKRGGSWCFLLVYWQFKMLSFLIDPKGEQKRNSDRT